MASSSLSEVLNAAVLRLLKPLVRILLRNGISFGQFAELGRRAYMEVARDEFQIPGKPQTASRISTVTGLTRKDVQRLNKQQSEDELVASAKFNRAARVISAWISEPDYQVDKQPKCLKFESGAISFSALVKEASGDITARTILDELLHIGAVEILDSGLLQLKVRAYIPAGDDKEKVAILGVDVADLINTLDHNIKAEPGQSYFQRKVYYDNLPIEVMVKLRAEIEQKAQAALEAMSEDMAACDRDRQPKLKGCGRVRAGLGIYYFESEIDDDKR